MRHRNACVDGFVIIHMFLDAIGFILKDRGESQSPYWLASQMIEMRLWRASEHDVQAALERNITKWGDRSL